MQKRLPLWVGGGGEKRTLRTAARYADGWNRAYMSPHVFRHKNQVLNEWCEKEGRDPATIARSVNLGFYLKTDPSAAAAERRDFFAWWGAMARKMAGGMLFGTPKDAIERVEQYFNAGATSATVALRAPFDWDALRGYVEEFLLAFNGK